MIDRLYFSHEGLTREKPPRKVSRRKRRHVSRVTPSFFNFLAPNMNTKDVDSIDHKSLIAKYIDYLLLENEHITEMSKSVSVTIENCVMDDPYLMDIIKVKIPFPTPKYLQWLKVYYPQIQVDWDAVNNELSTYIPDSKGQKKRTYYLDSRPFPVLLGESFYFFQREKDRMTLNPETNMQ
ncbi:hypothetical protein FSP39_015248 [Pinctada imbricata]|uniref:Uncharacterized protein n=1 Tax=Pinctada imbricata TaxID=66713 RepID=A0AA88YNT1_PINIB|nr:hypothetical protein FSP39_015248 [Pinctada imbricata]